VGIYGGWSVLLWSAQAEQFFFEKTNRKTFVAVGALRSHLYL
jgi:hypothetical protein